MLLKLKVTEGSSTGKVIAVRGNKFLIGRADECDLRPHSDAISRRHCVIIITEKAVGVRDLKSRNGTLVNGEKITGDKRLRHGDTLNVGPLGFEIILEKSAKTTAPAKKQEISSTAPKRDGGPMGGMVSQWLEEADDFAKEEQSLAAPETREYRFDDTSRIAVNSADEPADQTVVEEANEDEATKAQKDKNKKKEPGKLRKFEVKKEQPKDTQEAASQVLRKLFNRG